MNTGRVELNDLNIYFKKEEINLPLLVKEISSNEIKGKRLSAENGSRNVHLVGYENKKFTARNDREIDNRFEKRTLDLIFEFFYSHIIRRLARLAPEQRACIADLYYAAEEYHSRRRVEVSAVREYIDGRSLVEINENDAEEMKNRIIKLHSAGLTSNDIHPGDFIRTPSGELKVIDPSCKGIMKICQANDILMLRGKYNVDIQGHGFVHSLILLKEKLCRLSRRIRGK